jgi:hypothetical protein
MPRVFLPAQRNLPGVLAARIPKVLTTFATAKSDTYFPHDADLLSQQSAGDQQRTGFRAAPTSSGRQIGVVCGAVRNNSGDS